MLLPTVNVPRRFDHLVAEVVEWQTRTFEGRVAKAVRVQVPPSAPTLQRTNYSARERIEQNEWLPGIQVRHGDFGEQFALL